MARIQLIFSSATVQCNQRKMNYGIYMIFFHNGLYYLFKNGILKLETKSLSRLTGTVTFNKTGDV